MSSSNEKMDKLVDLFSDHLWKINDLDYEFLKSFPQFKYQGKAFRVLFLKKNEDVQDLTHQSFSKSLEGLNQYKMNIEKFDKSALNEREKVILECDIDGLDVHKFLVFVRDEYGGLSQATLNHFINEEEIICFAYSGLKKLP